MSNSFKSDSKKEKTKINLSYKYGELYAINLEIDKEEKDLNKLNFSLENSCNVEKSIKSKENKLKNSMDARDNIYKELCDINDDLESD